MIQSLIQFLQQIPNWPFWRQFELIEANPTNSGSIFGLGEFLAALALFLVVVTIADFRYSYRLSLTRTDLKKVGFWVAFGIGVAVLGTDVWFENGLPIPRIFSHENNLKALFGVTFVTYVFRVIWPAVIRPPAFSKRNATEFFAANYHLIHQGNPDRLQIIAEELRRSIGSIVAVAAKIPKARKKNNEAIPQEQACAHDFLLLLADTRFCKVVVDKVPAFAFACFLGRKLIKVIPWRVEM